MRHWMHHGSGQTASWWSMAMTRNSKRDLRRILEEEWTHGVLDREVTGSMLRYHPLATHRRSTCARSTCSTWRKGNPHRARWEWQGLVGRATPPGNWSDAEAVPSAHGRTRRRCRPTPCCVPLSGVSCRMWPWWVAWPKWPTGSSWPRPMRLACPSPLWCPGTGLDRAGQQETLSALGGCPVKHWVKASRTGSSAWLSPERPGCRGLASCIGSRSQHAVGVQRIDATCPGASGPPASRWKSYWTSSTSRGEGHPAPSVDDLERLRELHGWFHPEGVAQERVANLMPCCRPFRWGCGGPHGDGVDRSTGGMMGEVDAQDARLDRTSDVIL